MKNPRIKVQVKHRLASATDVSDLRALVAVLGSRDVDIFVSAAHQADPACGSSKRQQPHRTHVPAIARHQRPDLLG